MTEETIGKITTIDPVKGTLVVDSWDGKRTVSAVSDWQPVYVCSY